MYSNNSKRSLSGSFRLSPREHGAINHLRYRRNMNLQHIATLLNRSVATVHRALNIRPLDHVDNRGQTRTAYKARAQAFVRRMSLMKLQLKTYLAGLVETVAEALENGALTATLQRLLSENSGSTDEDDPA